MLIVEVAETTLRYDRKTKAPLYARHGILEYWIVDLEHELLDRYRDPHELTYAHVDRPEIDQPISPVALPALAVDLRPVFA